MEALDWKKNHTQIIFKKKNLWIKFQLYLSVNMKNLKRQIVKLPVGSIMSRAQRISAKSFQESQFFLFNSLNFAQKNLSHSTRKLKFYIEWFKNKNLGLENTDTFKK